MSTYTDPIIENAQFQQIVTGQEPDIACESKWHGGMGGRPEEPAEWVVKHKNLCPSGHGGNLKLACDGCLQAYLAYEGFMHCGICGHRHGWVVARHSIEWYEPIRKEAA